MLAAEFGEMAEIIFRNQIRYGAAHVPQKTLGHRRVVHDAAGERGQKFQQVVAAPLLEFRAEIFIPVLAADFVAVNERGVERLAGERADVVENFLHEAVPMQIERGLAELVALQTFAFLGRGMIFLAGRRAAEAQDDPLTGGNFPI